MYRKKSGRKIYAIQEREKEILEKIFCVWRLNIVVMVVRWLGYIYIASSINTFSPYQPNHSPNHLTHKWLGEFNP